MISKYGVGTDMLDMRGHGRHGVRLGWTGGVNKRSVTELAIAFMIALLHEVPRPTCELRAGVWKNRQGRQLSGRTVGIIGCGNIGKDLAPILRALRMHGAGPRHPRLPRVLRGAPGRAGRARRPAAPLRTS